MHPFLGSREVPERGGRLHPADVVALRLAVMQGLVLYLVGAQSRPPPAADVIDAPPLHIHK